MVLLLATLGSVATYLVLKHVRKSKNSMFTLPGWEDVVIGQPPPSDIAWTCHVTHPNDPRECKGRREKPIATIGVHSRPDIGVVGIWSVDIDASTAAGLRRRWGTPARTNVERDVTARTMLWCSPDRTIGAELEEIVLDRTPRYTVAIGNTQTRSGHACKETGTTTEPSQRDRSSVSGDDAQRLCVAYVNAVTDLCKRCENEKELPMDEDHFCWTLVAGAENCDQVTGARHVENVTDRCIPALNAMRCEQYAQKDGDGNFREPPSCMKQFTINRSPWP